MENFKAIHFQRARDFSSKINATVVFITQNYKSLTKSIIYIAGPPVLVCSLLLSSFMGDFFKVMMGAGRNPEQFQSYFLTTSFWAQVILMFIFMLVSYVAIIATTNNYLILYEEQKTNNIDINDVWARVRDSLGMYFVTCLLMGLVIVAAYVVLIIPIVILGAISPFLIFFGVVFFIVAAVYFMVGSSLVFAVRSFEKKGFFPAVMRSFFLVRGKWWSTFGLTMILSLLVGIVSYVFSVPASIIQAVSGLHSVQSGTFEGPTGVVGTIVFILNALAYLCQLLLYLVPNIGLAFQYFNLVELKEAKGLMSDIQTFGQAPTAPTPEEHY